MQNVYEKPDYLHQREVVMADFQLRQIAGGSLYFPGPANIGLIDTAAGSWLVDSGNDKEAGRKLNRVLSDTGRTLAGIACTHSNSDHIGGNRFLQQKTGCRVLASRGEEPFISSPGMEPAFLWGGRPFRQITNKFFKAQPSEVSEIFEPEYAYEFGKIIPLPGHFVDQVGILSPHRVLYLGDSLFGVKILEKYRIPYIYDIEDFRESIGIIRSIKADWYLPGHGELVSDIGAVADANCAIVDNLESCVLETLKESLQFEELLKRLCDGFGVELNAGSTFLSAILCDHYFRVCPIVIWPISLLPVTVCTGARSTENPWYSNSLRRLLYDREETFRFNRP